jgi:hypothetical protein
MFLKNWPDLLSLGVLTIDRKQMKSLFVALLMMASTTFAEPKIVRESNGSLPNLLCQYAFFDNAWRSRGGFASIFEVNGKIYFGNIYGSTEDKTPPGSGICMGRDLDEGNHLISFKLFTYSFEKEFWTMPGSCEVHTAGAYEITNQVKVTPTPGLVTEMTMERNDGTKLRYTNYFLTEADEVAWAKDQALIDAKCAELAPKSQLQ